MMIKNSDVWKILVNLSFSAYEVEKNSGSVDWRSG